MESGASRCEAPEENFPVSLRRRNLCNSATKPTSSCHRRPEAVAGGFLQVADNQVTVLSERAESA
jgi:hypothetical protein